MAAVSDKAEFYIEQTVPELQEWLRKEIFSKAEITQLTSRRTRFEHLVNSREATPSVYARYASYEMNLESLRRKRAKRTGVKMAVHTGQRRIYYVLDRATKKFHGDLGLWMLYIEYARRCKANKKTEEMLVKVLRMHPGKPELWIYAANWALDEEGDMDAARGYLQRGLRFCERAKDLWVEYAKLEMIYIAKIVGRRRVLGLDGPRAAAAAQPVEADGAELDADTIALPTVTAADLLPALAEREEDAADIGKQLASNPVMAGAIPLSIFDAAMNKFHRDAALAVRFFDVFAEFGNLPCLRAVLQHVLDSLQGRKESSLSALDCGLRMFLVGVEPLGPDFPSALGKFLAGINTALAEKLHPPESLAACAVKTLIPLSLTDALDDSLRRVMDASIRRYVKKMDGPHLARMVEAFRAGRRAAAANALLELGSKHLGPSAELQRLGLPPEGPLIAVDD